MKKVLAMGLAIGLAIVALFATVSAVPASDDLLKGRWVLTLDTPVGRLPIPAAFKGKGTGDLSVPEAVPLVYRESGGSLSISSEIPAANSPTGQAFTLLLRGTAATDTMQGTLLIITDTPDPNRPAADPVKVVVAPGTFTGQRTG